MQQLTALLTEAEKLTVQNEVERLFALQDMPLGNKKLGFFLDELFKSGLPSGALIQGLRALTKDGLSSIKIETILDSAYRHIQPEDRVFSECRECLRGEVFMKDELKREYSLACVCERGAHVAQVHGLARWDGSEIMTRKGRMLTLIKRVPLGTPGVVS